MKLVGSVLLLTLPALVFMYFYDLPMSGFVVGILALVAAWMGGEFFVRRQVQAMTRTAKKIADGDLDARTGLPASEDELGQLANILDRMAESLQQRNAERETNGEGFAQPRAGTDGRRRPRPVRTDHQRSGGAAQPGRRSGEPDAGRGIRGCVQAAAGSANCFCRRARAGILNTSATRSCPATTPPKSPTRSIPANRRFRRMPKGKSGLPPRRFWPRTAWSAA